MESKEKFLDIISTGCRLILLHFNPPNTKIRIINHTLQIADDTYTERYLYRPYYGDSRNDIRVLFPVIIRFIELYLIEKSPTRIDDSDAEIQVESNILGKIVFESEISEEEKARDKVKIECHKALIKFARFMQLGIKKLSATYGYDNASFTLQLFSNYLQAGIDGTFSRDMIPQHLLPVLDDNLLDVEKIKHLWSDENIIEVTTLFDKCIFTYNEKDNKMNKAWNAAINEMLNSRDEEFRDIISHTDSV